MYFVMHHCEDDIERKLYFADSIKNPYMVREIYNSLCMENDKQSPHRYFSTFCKFPRGGNVADVGAQEGMLGLNYISVIQKLYLFECDQSWIKALEATFEPYKEKISIIPKFVGDMNNDKFVKLDTYFADKDIHFVKMDIEGWELKALNGSNNLLKRKNVTWAVCSYHNSDDECKIIDKYRENEMEYAVSPGVVYVKLGGSCDLRHAVIWGKAKIKI